ncbi:MAG: hypothetical protein WCJ56_04555 [bacterium]
MTRYLVVLFALLGAVALFAQDLPVTGITLFSSGVGFMERSGKVKDNTSVQLSFKTEDINDLLKSMMVLDLNGGKIGAVTYGAKDPISKTLQSFAVNLNDNPTMGTLLNRVRGVEITVRADREITGKILGVETRQKAVGDKIITYEVLNLLTEDGMRSVPKDDISTFRLRDPKLNKELQDALIVMASGLDNQRKPVTLNFSGTGVRDVMVGYITKTPVWKTSYRLSTTTDKDSYLQGWAIVENTGDSDWDKVQLQLIAGRPISFAQDLYTPLYIQRPLVQSKLYASLRPVSYESALTLDADMDKSSITASMGPVQNHAYQAYNSNLAKVNGRDGVNGASMASFADGMTAGDALNSSVKSAATASNLGQAFSYKINELVTLPRQQSAMLPIVTSPVQTSKLSIFNPAVHASIPLYGMKVTNTTGLNLMGGPITVYDNGVYAGDATFEDLAPKEERLISYAMDLGIESNMDNTSNNDQVLSIKVTGGALYVQRKYTRTSTYTFRVKDGKDRNVMVEHTPQNGWTLVEPKKADETTDKLYRFNIKVAADKAMKFQVVEENITWQTIAMTTLTTDTLVYYSGTGKLNDKVRASIVKAIDMQAAINTMTAQITDFDRQRNDIVTEQGRIRQNMSTVYNSSTDLYKRYLTKLNDQETKLENLIDQQDAIRIQLKAKQKELTDYLHDLTVE